MDQFGLGTSFLPAEVGQLLPTFGCRSFGSHHVLWKGAGFPPTPGSSCPRRSPLVLLGSQTLAVRILVFRAEFPLKAIRSSPGKSTDALLPALISGTPLCWRFMSPSGLGHARIQLSVARLCLTRSPTPGFLCPVSPVCTSQTTCLQLTEPCCNQLASC